MPGFRGLWAVGRGWEYLTLAYLCPLLPPQPSSIRNIARMAPKASPLTTPTGHTLR